jgi:hypothetical protein
VACRPTPASKPAERRKSAAAPPPKSTLTKLEEVEAEVPVPLLWPEKGPLQTQQELIELQVGAARTREPPYSVRRGFSSCRVPVCAVPRALSRVYRVSELCASSALCRMP